MGAYGAEIMPAGHAEAVTPHASTNFAREMEGLYIGVGGDVVVVLPDDSAILFVGVPAGAILPVRCKRVNAVNTTATNIVALATRAS